MAAFVAACATGNYQRARPAVPDGADNPGGGAIGLPQPNADYPLDGVAAWGPPADASMPPDAAGQFSADPVARGRYLAVTGDCVSCHTNPGGKPFAGARPIRTPFGIFFSANITPDRKTGIGSWAEADFYRAMHKGIAHGGKNLYPVFPYTYFARMSRSDVDALWAYLRTLPPIYQPKPRNKVPFPLSVRPLMALWNALFFRPAEYRPNPTMSNEWNRGAYLVWGPGHCGGCHTPKNILGADRNRRALQGYTLDDWTALDLTGSQRTGLASWDKGEVVEYLRSGRNNRTTASGAMQEVVYNSTSRMSDSDLAAIATYLKGLPPGRTASDARRPSEGIMRSGEAVFQDNCSDCHEFGGEGPLLERNASVQAPDSTSIVRLILEGSRSVPTPAAPTAPEMPPFAWKLTNSQIASVATFIRNSWGNSAPPVSRSKVAKLRSRHVSD